jgi:exoribonuclease II
VQAWGRQLGIIVRLAALWTVAFAACKYSETQISTGRCCPKISLAARLRLVNRKPQLANPLIAPIQHFDFQRQAREEMLHEGFQPDFPPEVTQDVLSYHAASGLDGDVRDLRALLWSSIDNTESRDLDQIEWAERKPDGHIRVLVGVADVDAVVAANSATDSHARANATSVYTGGPVFPMLPEKLSTDLTSLGPDADRRAIVMEFAVASDGHVDCYGRLPGLGSQSGAVELRPGWKLVGKQIARRRAVQAGGPERTASPAKRGQPALEGVSQGAWRAGARRRGKRADCCQQFGPGFAAVRENAARDLIESFMVAANVAMAEFLRARNCLCLRRIVRTPKRWDRIQALAARWA